MVRSTVLLALLGLCSLAAAAQSELRAMPPLPPPPAAAAPSAGLALAKPARLAVLHRTPCQAPSLPPPSLAAMQTTPACSRPPTGSRSASQSAAWSTARCLAWTLPAAPACRRWAGRGVLPKGGMVGALAACWGSQAARVQPLCKAAHGGAAALHTSISPPAGSPTNLQRVPALAPAPARACSPMCCNCTAPCRCLCLTMTA